MSITVTRDDLARMYPRALPAWLSALDRIGDDLRTFYGFERSDWVCWCGQVAAETDGLSLPSMRENMHFKSATRILAVYSYRLGLALQKDASLKRRFGNKGALAAHLVGRPKELADIVYGGREGTPWMEGSRYIGRGPTQVTHLDNYRAVGAEISRQPGGAKIDLVGDPEKLATDAELGIRAAFADWHLKNLSKWARADDVLAVSKVLNTGSNGNLMPHGWERRQRETARAKAIWPYEGAVVAMKRKKAPASTSADVLREGCRGEAVRDLQAALKAAGYPCGIDDGVYGVLTRRAVLAFQAEHGLEPTGDADWSTGGAFRQALASTAPVDLGARAELTADDLRQRGSRQMALWGRIKSFGSWLIGGNAAYAADQASGLGIVEGAVSHANRVKSVATDASSLFGWLFQPGILVPAVLVLVGMGLVYLAVAGEDDRLQKARSGQDISK